MRVELLGHAVEQIDRKRSEHGRLLSFSVRHALRDRNGAHFDGWR